MISRSLFHPIATRILLIALILLLFRSFLFYNATIWNFYATALSPNDLGDTGWREYEFIREECRNQNFPRDFARGIEFLAVGSSQTAAIYAKYSKTNPDRLALLSMAGVGPIEFLLLRNWIRNFNPHFVLLYLSEFDIANTYFKPYLSNFRLAPNQGMYLLHLYPYFKQHSIWHFNSFLHVVMYEFFPEIKYNFVFKAFLDKLTGKKNSHAANMAANVATLTKEQLTAWQLEMLDYLKSDVVPFHIALLEEFLQWCVDEKIKVIIVEGQYRIDGKARVPKELKKQVLQRLTRLDQYGDNVTLITRSQLHEFTFDEYTDVYHVTPEAGFLFSTKLVSFLKKNHL